MLDFIARNAPTLLAADAVVMLAAVAGLLTYRRRTGTPAPTGRHHIDDTGEVTQYRPRSAAARPGPVVIPGPRLADAPTDALEADWTLSSEYDAAVREYRARALVAAAGKDWATSGIVHNDPAVRLPDGPDAWFGVPTDRTRELSRIR